MRERETEGGRQRESEREREGEREGERESERERVSERKGMESCGGGRGGGGLKKAWSGTWNYENLSIDYLDCMFMNIHLVGMEVFYRASITWQ